MSRGHGGGSHNQHAIPDEKMNTRRWKFRRPFSKSSPRHHHVTKGTSTQRQAEQKNANAKRRRRDREVTRDHDDD